jgi:chemotaxis protein MotA
VDHIRLSDPGMHSSVHKHAPSRRASLDGAAAVGLVAGLALLTAAVVLGGSPGAFLDSASFLIVIGGTFAAVVVCFSLSDVLMTLRVAGNAVLHAAPDPQSAAVRALGLAVDARVHGILDLEGRLDREGRTPFLVKALGLVADNATPAELENVLGHDVHATPHRFRRSAAVLRRAADCAPAMGLIGTLIGLVQMLGQLGDPQHMGPAMAIALLTTLYGAVLAHMVFSPLAVKLERNAVDEELVCRIYLLSAVSISRRENPRRLELLLNGLLPPAKRVTYFD